MNISQPGGLRSDGVLLNPQKQTVGAAALQLMLSDPTLT